MPKPNAMLARIEAAAKARYQARLHTSMDMLLQLGQDAAAIATHVVFQLGPGGAYGPPCCRFGTKKRFWKNCLAEV